jgi:hypothetical protein
MFPDLRVYVIMYAMLEEQWKKLSNITAPVNMQRSKSRAATCWCEGEMQRMVGQSQEENPEKIIAILPKRPHLA